MKGMIILEVLPIMFTILFYSSVFGEEKNFHQKIVVAENGLRLREKGDVLSKTIDLIPFGEKVVIVEVDAKEQTIDNVKGSWCKIKWKGRAGWVFSGYLSDRLVYNKSLIYGKYEQIYEYEKPILHLKNDSTFIMSINYCQGMIEIKGTYQILDNKIILQFEPNQYKGFLGENDNQYIFEIVSSSELKFLNNVGCAPTEQSVFKKIIK